jgi:hypothetical protein
VISSPPARSPAKSRSPLWPPSRDNSIKVLKWGTAPPELGLRRVWWQSRGSGGTAVLSDLRGLRQRMLRLPGGTMKRPS